MEICILNFWKDEVWNNGIGIGNDERGVFGPSIGKQRFHRTRAETLVSIVTCTVILRVERLMAFRRRSAPGSVTESDDSRVTERREKPSF